MTRPWMPPRSVQCGVFGQALQLDLDFNAGGQLKSGEGFFDYSGSRGAAAVEARNRKLTAISKILFET